MPLSRPPSFISYRYVRTSRKEPEEATQANPEIAPQHGGARILALHSNALQYLGTRILHLNAEEPGFFALQYEDYEHKAGGASEHP